MSFSGILAIIRVQLAKINLHFIQAHTQLSICIEFSNVKKNKNKVIIACVNDPICSLV